MWRPRQSCTFLHIGITLLHIGITLLHIQIGSPLLRKEEAESKLHFCSLFNHFVALWNHFVALGKQCVWGGWNSSRWLGGNNRARLRSPCRHCEGQKVTLTDWLSCWQVTHDIWHGSHDHHHNIWLMSCFDSCHPCHLLHCNCKLLMKQTICVWRLYWMHCLCLCTLVTRVVWFLYHCSPFWEEVWRFSISCDIWQHGSHSPQEV